MALIAQPLKVNLVMRDRARSAHTSFHIGAVAGALPTPAEIAFVSGIAPFSFVFELYGNFIDVSDCAPVGYDLVYSYREDPAQNFDAPPANPNVERKGVYQFSTNQNGRTLITVPGININAQAPNGKDLTYTTDPTTGEPTFTGPLAGDLQSIHDKMRNGATIGAVTYPVTGATGLDINKFIAAYQQTRASSGKG